LRCILACRAGAPRLLDVSSETVEPCVTRARPNGSSATAPAPERTGSTRDSAPPGEPTPEEIRQRCAEVRATWNETTRLSRTVATPDPVETAIIRVAELRAS